MSRPRGSVTLAAARLVRVDAHLDHPIRVHPWFPLPLDGLLAAAGYRRRGGRVRHETVHLPLLTTGQLGTRFPRGGTRWVWSASCAWWPGAALPDPDDQDDVTTGRDISWWCLGNPAAVVELLSGLPGVGARERGARAVWSVTEHGAATEKHTRIWWREDGRISRPIAVRHADVLGLTSAPDVVEVDSYRPPYWRTMPTTEGGRFDRTEVEVIAPWTTRTRSRVA